MSKLVEYIFMSKIAEYFTYLHHNVQYYDT